MSPGSISSHLHALAEATSILPRSRLIMKTVESQAAKLFARCFTREEFEFLQAHPEFIEANRKLETIDDALDAVELGEQLVKATWRRPRIGTHAETDCALLCAPGGVNIAVTFT